jgi:hypothetical protein
MVNDPEAYAEKWADDALKKARETSTKMDADADLSLKQ